MTISPHTTTRKKFSRTSEAVPERERAAAAQVASLLAPDSAKDGGALEIVGAKGQRFELPSTLMNVMRRAAQLIAGGQTVAVVPDEKMLSTQAAANLLNVSRQYLVRLVDSGELAAVKVGSHRRLQASDVAAFKIARDAKRRSALDRLAELSEAAGGYEADVNSR
jgi:excisionase family DNA binding protein